MLGFLPREDLVSAECKTTHRGGLRAWVLEGGEGGTPLTLAAFSPSLWDATISSCEVYGGVGVRCRMGKERQQLVVVFQQARWRKRSVRYEVGRGRSRFAKVHGSGTEIIRRKSNWRRMRGFGWGSVAVLDCGANRELVCVWSISADEALPSGLEKSSVDLMTNALA
jgi:hypothetical protein